jgi:AraC-like DNA-binding protein
VQALRRAGSLRPCYNADHYGTDIAIVGDGQPQMYCLMVMLSGAMEMVEGPNGTAAAHGTKGMILRGSAGTRFQTTDNSARLALWIDAARLERALAARLGEPPRQALAFSPGVDWNTGPAAAVGRLITHLFEELRDPHGIASDPTALETFTDLLLHTALHRLEHNHSARLDRPAGVAVPRHLRRAEAFMHDAADRPIVVADVAAAAGCSLGTLQVAFRRFRETTLLAALHDIRLQHVRKALLTACNDEPTGAIARRFGFTNPSRFIAAYGKRFGEHPNETRQRTAA